MTKLTDPALKPIAAKLREGLRLDAADGLTLLTTSDLHGLGALADRVRRRRHGRRTYYNVNRHINYTNRCILACRFCGFRRDADSDQAHEMTLDEIAAVAAETARLGGSEVHVTGGLHPQWRIEYYEQMVRAIRTAAPGIHIKAFTAVELAHIAQRSDLPVRDVLVRLISCGLDSLPGGGAEIFDQRVQAETFSGKMGAQGWFDVHRIAHQLGLPSNATMLYGHVETLAERITHLVRLRDLQDRSGGFRTFVPLSFIPAGSAMSHLPGPSGLDDLKTMAVSRLMLDNFEHIKTFWIMHTVKLSQLALSFGADDIDGTVRRYEITTPGGQTRQEMTVSQLRSVITEAGFTPVERDSLYRPVDSA